MSLKLYLTRYLSTLMLTGGIKEGEGRFKHATHIKITDPFDIFAA